MDELRDADIGGEQFAKPFGVRIRSPLVLWSPDSKKPAVDYGQ
jgi:hypothetical protein